MTTKEGIESLISLCKIEANRSIINLLRKFEIKRNGTAFVLIAPNSEFKRWAEEFLLRGVSNPNIRVVERRQPEKEEEKERIYNGGVCSRYTFDNFVVGSSNKIVYQVAREVSENPGNLYNPLVIYGRVGVGKTHILHAIGNNSLDLGYRVVYKSINDFSDELIRMLRKNNLDGFRDKYKEVDVLLIDDIQFLRNKERTQVELFNIFNNLYMLGKQIVLTSDRHPKELTDLSDRLINRFTAGLIMELDIDMETKRNIVIKKLKEHNIHPTKDIVNYILENTEDNVRSVEGAIARLKVYGTEDLESDKEEGISFDRIKRIVANFYGLNPEDLEKGSRKKKIADARHICMYISKKLMEEASLIQIGRAFGLKDHTSVIHAINKVEQRKKKDRKFCYSLSVIENRIKSSN